MEMTIIIIIIIIIIITALVFNYLGHDGIHTSERK